MKRLLKYIVLIFTGGLGFLRVIRRYVRRAFTETPHTEARGEETPRFRWKRRMRTIGGFLAVAAVGGLLIAALGLIPLKASSGHWAITRIILNWSMARSVATYSMGIDAPSPDSLDNRSLVLKGAGHYESGCQPCHGSPVLERPRIPQEMTPEPPYLPELIAEWEAEELFYIVKHGVKFTGMPAWPARQRDDEIWAMVAFLQELPELSAGEYRELVGMDRDPEVVARVDTTLGGELEPDGLLEMGENAKVAETSCGRCHGRKGSAAFPRLAGQHPTYLYNSLRAYAEGTRNSGIMMPLAAGLTSDEMRAAARYYGTREDAPLGTEAEGVVPELIGPILERGREIAHAGVPGEGIPSCVDCHGPNRIERNPAYPILAGQYAEYLLLQLRLFNTGRRGGSVYMRLMHPTAHRLTPEQMRAVSLYYESLGTSTTP